MISEVSIVGEITIFGFNCQGQSQVNKAIDLFSEILVENGVL